MNVAKDLISDALNEEFGEKIRNGETVTAEDIEEFLARMNNGN